MHFFNTQVSRFQTGQKGRKRTLLNEEVIPLVENYLSVRKDSDNYIYFSLNDIKKRSTKVIKDLEKFVFNRSDDYLFPQNHF